METAKTLKEILELDNIAVKIELLKKGRLTPMPNTEQNIRDWKPELHEIMDVNKVPKIKVMTEMERVETTEVNGIVETVTIPPQYTYKEPNRIALPIEQDIVNIQTSFTVGIEPKLICTSEDEKENGLFKVLGHVFKTNKLKYQNRAEVRSWLAEQEMAEYWYVAPDNKSFWKRVASKVKSAVTGKEIPNSRLRSVVWSPFRGDLLYPYFNENGDLVAFSRGYKRKLSDGNYRECFMVITDTDVLVYERDTDWELIPSKSFKHGFEKLPVIYGYRRHAYCSDIRPIRERIEKCLSGYADCIDNHFFPKLLLFGELENLYGTDPRNQILQMQGDGVSAQYLTWNQSADPIKVEIETYFNEAYALTNTPRISFDQIKGTGNALSGVAFRYVFMAAHQAVMNHAEVLGEFFQRRVNFLISALGTMNASLKEASETIDVECEIQPFIIDSESDKVTTAAAAISGGVWSLEHGVAYCSDYGDAKDEVEKIIEERKEQQNNG